MKYYLIDYENVNAAGLEGMDEITPDSRVVLFYTKNSSKIDLGVFNLLRSSEAELAVIEVQHGKQALDIQLASYVGFLIGTESVDTEYYIVSKDKGYRNIQDFWSDRHIYLCTSLREDSQLTDDDSAPTKKSSRSGSRSGSRGGRKSSGKSDAKDHDRSPKGGSRSRSSEKSGVRSEPKREETPMPEAETAEAAAVRPSEPETPADSSTVIQKEKPSRELDGFALAREAVASLNAAANKAKAEEAESREEGKSEDKAEAEASPRKAEDDSKSKAAGKSKTSGDNPKASSHRNEVNTEIQKILSKAGIAGDVINSTASFVSKNIDKDGYKQLIYRGIIKEHGQKKGLELYRLIKGVL